MEMVVGARTGGAALVVKVVPTRLGCGGRSSEAERLVEIGFAKRWGRRGRGRADGGNV